MRYGQVMVSNPFLNYFNCFVRISVGRLDKGDIATLEQQAGDIDCYMMVVCVYFVFRLYNTRGYRCLKR